MKVNLQAADNARDFRGIQNTYGKSITTKRFIRSNHLNSLTEDDINVLTKEYGLVKVIDLRTALEVEQKPDTAMEGVEHIHIPLFDESAIGITHEANTDMQAAGLADIPDMRALYVRLVEDDYSVSQLSKVMNIIADNGEGAVLWHCTEGKDRCGIVSMMFLAMLDVDTESIMEDYLRTNIMAAKRADKFYENIVRITSNKDKASEVKTAFMANEDYLNAALHAIFQNYSSIRKYVEERLKVGRDKIERLQEICF